MAKFVNTRKAVSDLEDLIRNAGERLVLISPYLRLSKDFQELLQYRNSKERVTTVVYGKQDLKPEEMAFLQGLRFVSLKFKEDLHAKCYYNDSRMLITSLNLYEFSMANNKEMGVLIDKNDPADAQLFQDALNEAEFIISNSQGFEFTARKSQAERSDSGPKSKRVSRTEAPTGYCIGTGVEIPFDIEKPMTYEQYKRWKKEGGDVEQPQKFCHFSGEESDGATSVSRPILKKHWKAAQAAHGL